ncbi:hypothetical protein [Hymenobacter terrenus]|uniref:hypothetical protein n=1 Tax=Hymenobacter terrenus TaxID=1629124 RepID=UPI00061971FF|nr:hypothetical protein [Hymenobacter terrenus]
MKPQSLFSLRYFASLLLLLSLFATACSNDKGKVEGVNMLYGTDSKVWKTAKQTDASGDKVKQDDAQKQQELHVFANGNYTMTDGAAGAISGKYEFDQAGRTISFAPEGSTTKNVFAVETLTDDKLTIKSANGEALMLEAE